MQLLEQLGVRFNESGIPLLVLKGAALHLTVSGRMADVGLGPTTALPEPASRSQTHDEVVHFALCSEDGVHVLTRGTT